MNGYTDDLTQAERLEQCAGTTVIDPASIGVDERTARPVKLSRKQRRTRAICGLNGFKMPSASRVREHDALLSAYGSECNVHEEQDDEEQDDENELRDHAYAKRTDSMREHSFRLPSQRSRRDVTDTLRTMGMSYHD